MIDAFENLDSCNRTVAVRGVRQDDNGGTGPNGTGTAAPAIFGNAANNPLNSSSCSNYFGVRINPSDTGNIRGQSRFTLADGILLTVDPSFQYVLANGGGSTAFEENRCAVPWFEPAAAGVDLNGDGDFARPHSPALAEQHQHASLRPDQLADLGILAAAPRRASPTPMIAPSIARPANMASSNREGDPLSPFGGRNCEPGARLPPATSCSSATALRSPCSTRFRASISASSSTTRCASKSACAARSSSASSTRTATPKRAVRALRSAPASRSARCGIIGPNDRRPGDRQRCLITRRSKPTISSASCFRASASPTR